MLSVRIKKNFENFRLDVTFETEGEVLGLLGASGCGKSMTLKCIAGIERPDEGRVVLNGRVLFDSAKKINLPPQKRRVGYLFQQYALFPNMTVAQNIAAGCRERDRAKREVLVREKIRAMRLEGLEKKRPAALSGGQQQRAALARILINEPELLLLDEPFTALDSYLRWQLELELSDTLKAFGRGALFVSHNRDEVYRLCDSVCVLDRGKSEKKRPVRELFEAPETLAECLLSGCKNYSRIRPLEGGRVEAVDWGVALEAPPLPEGADHIGVRAHFVKLSASPAGENAFPCAAVRVVEDVFSTVVMLKTPGGSEGYALLRAEMGKAEWEKLKDFSVLYAAISPPDIMPLKSEPDE